MLLLLLDSITHIAVYQYLNWLVFQILFLCSVSTVLNISCRDIKDTSIGTLSQRITNQLMGLKGLVSQLKEIHSYLDNVANGRLPINHQIIYMLQDVFNLLPDVNLQVKFITSLCLH